MKIISAIELNNNQIIVIGEDKEVIFQEEGVLYGYTDEYVTIIKGNMIYIYDSKGNEFHKLSNVAS